MDWNSPLTAKQFVIIFWVPVLLLLIAWFAYGQIMAESPPATVKQVKADDLAREQRELHENIEAVEHLRDRTVLQNDIGQHNQMGH